MLWLSRCERKSKNHNYIKGFCSDFRNDSLPSVKYGERAAGKMAEQAHSNSDEKHCAADLGEAHQIIEHVLRGVAYGLHLQSLSLVRKLTRNEEASFEGAVQI